MGLERQSKAVDALRLSDSQRANILAEMDRSAQKTKSEGINKRVHTRYTYQSNAGLMVQIVHPGGSGCDYLVKPRNISTGGIGFLHGGYVHNNTACIIHLRTLDGEVAAVNGLVMNCRHVSGRVHEVGVKFSSTVDLTDFVENFVKSETDTQVSVALPRLAGGAIYVEDSVNDRELMAFRLRQLGVEMTSAANGADALSIITASPVFDIMLVDKWLPGNGGPEFIKTVRAGGYPGPIVGVTADDSAEGKQEMLGAGANEVFIKPYRIEQLVGMLAKYLKNEPADSEKIVSSMWSDVEMRPIILGFLTRLETQIKTLETAVKNQETQAVETFCRELRGSAAGYGFKPLTESAQMLGQTLAGGMTLEQAQKQIDKLVDLCRNACQSVKAA